MTPWGLQNNTGNAAPFHPWQGCDVWELLKLQAVHRGQQPALIWHPYSGSAASLSYADLLQRAASLGAGLARRGVKRGDKVLIHLENCPEFVLSWFACAALGAVAVTTNTRSAGAEIRFFAEDCGAVCAITQPRFAQLISSYATGIRWQVVTDNDSGEQVASQQRVVGEDSFASLFADPSDLPPHEVDPRAPMSVQYTSGTTSRPKGVLWTHGNALWGARVNAAHEGLRPDDCHLIYMPLFHANALAYSMLASLYVGARFVLVPKWSTSRFWDISLRYRCTWLALMPLSVRAIVALESPEHHSYRTFGYGFSDGPWDKTLGVKTVGWWGMTETISHPIVGDPYTPNRPMAIGRPAPEYRVTIVRSDGVTEVEPEEPGDLLVSGVRGLSLFAEYLNNPDATAASFDERGWFRTGDIVTPHADGYISFTDRAKDMLRVGSENVAASEVEQVVLVVEGIREAALVGRPDDKLDEVPVLFVTTSTDDPDIVDRVMLECREKLASFKVPREVIIVPAMPHSTISKINKVELRMALAVDADQQAALARWVEEAKIDPSGEHA